MSTFVLAFLEPYFPRAEGLLPHWQLFVAVMAIFSSLQNLVTPRLTRRIYDNVPSAAVTGLQARTFAVWNLILAVVRGYAAFNIHDKTIYDMAMLTYLIAFCHFTSELFLFRTTKSGILMPAILATFSLFWMIYQYDFYVVVVKSLL